MQVIYNNPELDPSIKKSYIRTGSKDCKSRGQSKEKGASEGAQPRIWITIFFQRK